MKLEMDWPRDETPKQNVQECRKVVRLFGILAEKS